MKEIILNNTTKIYVAKIQNYNKELLLKEFKTNGELIEAERKTIAEATEASNRNAIERKVAFNEEQIKVDENASKARSEQFRKDQADYVKAGDEQRKYIVESFKSRIDAMKKIADALEKEAERIKDAEAALRNKGLGSGAKFGKGGQTTSGEGQRSGKSIFEEQQQQLKSLSDLVEGTLTPVFEQFFSTIAEGGNAFKAFGNAAAKALQQVITKLLVTAAISGVLSLIPGAGSFLSIFKGLLGFKASGGPVSAGGSYIVGEKGPELFTPNTGGRITANSQLGAGMSGGGMRIEIVGNSVIRGMDLIQILTIANQSKNRLI